jgi:prophage regulatory protein
MSITEQKQVSRAIRLPEVCHVTGASRATIWRWANDDQSFPKPYRLSPAITVWDEDEILQWIALKKAQKNARFLLAAHNMGPITLDAELLGAVIQALQPGPRPSEELQRQIEEQARELRKRYLTILNA